ncbi:hypothetical protein [Subtercola sp. RTI3]|uniref:hypothetical protein n=1 Tax=Subtercola sp. RTI3 TaxID=3048639 RepID=UPI002B23D6E4|nr:hypothetical protein [Subtercola sp. RTI3]MEA9984944.1 hypothetical protein [Subtercola sp. RTI3]
MSEFTGDPDAAEADLQRASDALGRVDDDLSDAVARAEGIEEEPFDGSPEAEADISQRMEAVQREIELLQQLMVEAEDDLSRTQDHWVDEGHLS